MDPIRAQHRLVYSLLKPVVHAAARFEVSIGILTDLLRVAYFEVLVREHGLNYGQIARHFGQSERHMRSLAKRLGEDFFEPEREIGLVREVERVIAAQEPTQAQLEETLSSWSSEEISQALAKLEHDERIVRDDRRFRTAKRYVLFRSETFSHRIDALNHFLGGVSSAVMERLVFDNKTTAMIKTLTFAAKADELSECIARLEGNLRRELAQLEESANFSGASNQQFTMTLTLTPVDGTSGHDSQSGSAAPKPTAT